MPRWVWALPPSAASDKHVRALRTAGCLPRWPPYTAIGKARPARWFNEFKKPESTVNLIRPILDPFRDRLPQLFSLKANYKDRGVQTVEEGMVASASRWATALPRFCSRWPGQSHRLRCALDMLHHRMPSPCTWLHYRGVETVPLIPCRRAAGRDHQEYTLKAGWRDGLIIWLSCRRSGRALEPVYSVIKAVSPWKRSTQAERPLLPFKDRCGKARRDHHVFSN